jgi:hypothetical protein
VVRVSLLDTVGVVELFCRFFRCGSVMNLGCDRVVKKGHNDSRMRLYDQSINTAYEKWHRECAIQMSKIRSECELFLSGERKKP